MRQTIQLYAAPLVRLAMAYVKNQADAEDIVQEVFVTRWRKPPVLKDGAQERAWLTRVTINRCKDHLRACRRRQTVPLTDDLSALPSEDSDLLHALWALDIKYRLPLYLFYFDDYTIAEIAALLRAKPSTVGTWLQRGRELLKNELGDDPV